MLLSNRIGVIMENNLYCCYSVNLKDYLSKRNIRYGIVALNPNNQKMFWVYIKTPELDRALTEWSNRK